MHKFIQFSQTRWLARVNIIKIILGQWIELKGYFNIIINSEKSYMAKVLHNMLHDNINFIYLTVVYSIINQVNNINILFQRNNTDIFKIYSDLYGLLINCMTLIIKPIFMEGLQDMSDSNLQNIETILQNSLYKCRSFRFWIQLQTSSYKLSHRGNKIG